MDCYYFLHSKLAMDLIIWGFGLVQWTLTYPDLSYPEYSFIWPRSLHILFNAHAAYGEK